MRLEKCEGIMTAKGRARHYSPKKPAKPQQGKLDAENVLRELANISNLPPYSGDADCLKIASIQLTLEQEMHERIEAAKAKLQAKRMREDRNRSNGQKKRKDRQCDKGNPVPSAASPST
jgi:hypothetical protein